MIGLFVLAIAGGGYWWYQRIELDTMDRGELMNFGWNWMRASVL